MYSPGRSPGGQAAGLQKNHGGLKGRHKGTGMTLYSYKGFTQEGKRIQGTIEAGSDYEAKGKIRELQIILSELREQHAKSIKSLASDVLIILTSQLSQLLGAKIPLYESLLALEEQYRNTPPHFIILSVTERIKSGSSFSKALEDFPDSFPPLYRALVTAGEAVGNLELSLKRLTSLLTYQQKMKKQLLSALTYPIFLVVLLFVAIGVLVGFVIPSIEALFEDKTLPWFTSVVFAASKMLRAYWPFIVATFLGLTFFCVFYLRQPHIKKRIQYGLLKLPVMKRYIIHASLARFGRTLSSLLEGGLPLTNSLAFATESLHNARLEDIMKRVSDKVIEGKTISYELSQYKEIPFLFSRMMKIGEESGQLAPLLNQVAAMYEEETERALNRLVTLSQPVLLIIMGGAIGTVILSILLPMSDIGNVMQL